MRNGIVRPLGLISIAVLSCAASTTAPAGDSPAVQDVRDTLIQWNTVGPTWTEADFRKLYHTTNPREAKVADFQARDDFAELKAQKLIRDKWGVEAEAKFAHLYESDTIKDDQTAAINVNSDHAMIAWTDSAIEKTHLIKVDGKWLIDIHPVIEQIVSDDPHPEVDDVKIESLMKQAGDDITAGKFDKSAGFFADFVPKYQALVDDDDE